MPKDLFSAQATDYSKYRPSYPAALIEYVISFVNERKMAWDCATGNGQAAALLSGYFEKVMATDISEKQLSQALAKENIVYSAGKAEQSHFADNSFDLITVAQAYHWFNFADFEKEANRVAKPGTIIATWGYNLPLCRHETINSHVQDFYTNVVGTYWDRERKYVEENYETVPFNFEALPSKTFSIPVNWNQNDLKGYLNSWSSVQHFIKATHYNPITEMATPLQSVWPKDQDMVEFIFPVFLKIGRIRK